MTNKKKDFFYNPVWRVGVYIIATFYLSIFKILATLIPKLKSNIDLYRDGQNGASVVIGFCSAIVLEIVFFLSVQKSVIWSLKTIAFLPMIYLAMGLVGWLSLTRMRDYEIEKTKS